jgi:hypothetical protein
VPPSVNRAVYDPFMKSHKNAVSQVRPCQALRVCHVSCAVQLRRKGAIGDRSCRRRWAALVGLCGAEVPRHPVD